MIGRHENGEPLARLNSEDLDDFDFRGDPQASRCPVQAHIRVMNPRDGRPAVPVVRRGMSYGPPFSNAASAEVPRGLLFLGLHRGLLDFLKLMARATNLRDPILSDSEAWDCSDTSDDGTHCPHGFRAQKWNIAGKEVCYAFADVSTLRGGEFFYIPSMNFIRQL